MIAAAPPFRRRKLTSGLLINFLSVDIQKIMDAVSSLHQFWSLPVQVAVTLYLLFTQVQWAFLAGLAVLAVFTPLNMVVSRRIGKLTGLMMNARDVRVRMTGELLAGE
jgi:ATP-binding cassette subfamily C (CFTR/MRP) protein 10